MSYSTCSFCTGKVSSAMFWFLPRKPRLDQASLAASQRDLYNLTRRLVHLFCKLQSLAVISFGQKCSQADLLSRLQHFVTQQVTGIRGQGNFSRFFCQRDGILLYKVNMSQWQLDQANKSRGLDSTLHRKSTTYTILAKRVLQY